MSIADRLRAHGVSEERLLAIGLATHSGELPEKLDDAELALAREYEQASPFDRDKIRARNPEGLDRGRAAARAIEAWIQKRNESK